LVCDLFERVCTIFDEAKVTKLFKPICGFSILNLPTLRHLEETEDKEHESEAPHAFVSHDLQRIKLVPTEVNFFKHIKAGMRDLSKDTEQDPELFSLLLRHFRVPNLSHSNQTKPRENQQDAQDMMPILLLALRCPR
jgi:hypothetical protein